MSLLYCRTREAIRMKLKINVVKTTDIAEHLRGLHYQWIAAVTPVADTEPWRAWHVRSAINAWVRDEKIPCSNIGLNWYFRDQEDVVMMVLRWS